MAAHLEDAGIKTTGKIEALACSTLTVMVMCKELERKKCKSKWSCVYTEKSLDPTSQRGGSMNHMCSDKWRDTRYSEGRNRYYLPYQRSSDDKLEDRFLLMGRVLPTSKLLGKVEFNCDALFKALKDKLPQNWYESRRFGGSSGKARYDQDLFNFLNNGGTTCRHGIGTIVERH
jgi:hypothetical protein